MRNKKLHLVRFEPTTIDSTKKERLIWKIDLSWFVVHFNIFILIWKRWQKKMDFSGQNVAQKIGYKDL